MSSKLIGSLVIPFERQLGNYRFNIVDHTIPTLRYLICCKDELTPPVVDSDCSGLHSRT